MKDITTRQTLVNYLHGAFFINTANAQISLQSSTCKLFWQVFPNWQHCISVSIQLTLFVLGLHVHTNFLSPKILHWIIFTHAVIKLEGITLIQ